MSIPDTMFDANVPMESATVVKNRDDILVRLRRTLLFVDARRNFFFLSPPPSPLAANALIPARKKQERLQTTGKQKERPETRTLNEKLFFPTKIKSETKFHAPLSSPTGY
jgi:hypothetical protein